VQTDLSGLQVDRLAAAVHDPFLQVEDAVLPKALNRRAGFGVELD